MKSTPSRRPGRQDEASVSAREGSLFRTLLNLWPYIWPSDRSDLKNRVVVAMVLLLFAKLATIAVPFTFKWATDALAGQGRRRADGQFLVGFLVDLGDRGARSR